ncbi:MAG TPA: DUF4062 domain-containing protein [Devosia sp.]|jgi:hypothetical protein|uniref:DUF4062 domain-containing protein n=1 Tax=Devosia sp. TaxID=1871048 RepID=UPI002DDD29DB|nr:DUF4062 domain-containing protein [Devosia sp.]HEV2516607.1 DUF4062 domain-containing protein [Devosia sp.]
MPRNDVVLSVFVASPSDTEEERSRIALAISEINDTWSRSAGIRLELVKWETHAYPALGEDAQDVINHQIGDDYDVFVGVMWQRFGSPTQRFSSGTEEEFHRAKARHDSDPRSVRVMFYFKDAPVAPSKIDLEQMAKVQAFRRTLGAAGSLHWSFEDSDHFEKLVRIHLQRVVQEWQRPIVEVPTPASPRELGPIDDENDDRGVLDYIIEFMDRFNEAAETMRETNELMETSGGRLQSMGNNLGVLTRASNPSDYKRARAKIAAIASELLSFERDFKAKSDRTLENFEAGVDAVIKFVEMQPTVSENDRLAVLQLVQVMDDVQQSIRDYHVKLSETEAIATIWPPVTRELNTARKRIQRTMGDVIVRYNNSELLIQELKQALFDLLRRGSTASPDTEMQSDAQARPV